MKKMYKKTAFKKGFSLIELLVVIVILGLLAAFIVPNIMGKSEQAKQQITCVQMKSLVQSLELFKQDNGEYPQTQEGLEALVKNPDPEKYTNFLKGGYLNSKTVPKDPWKNAYIYIQTEDGFDIISLGADKKEGGEDEKKDIKLSTCSN